MANTADFAPDILPQSPDQINSVLNQTTPAAPGGPVKGGLRSVLSGLIGNFSYGAGQAMKKQAGLPTDQELAMQNAALAHQNAQTQMVNQQTEQMKNLTPIDLGDGTVYRVPTAMATKLLEARIKATGTTQAAQIGATSRENVAKIQQGAPMTVDPEIAQLAGQPNLAWQQVGKGTLDNLNKSLSMKGYHLQDLGGEGMWLVDRAGNRLKQVGQSPSVARASAFASARAANTPFETVDENGNPTTISQADALRTGAPGIGRTNLTQVRGKQALIEDIRGGVEQVRQFSNVIDRPGVKVKVAAALADPGLSAQTILQSPIVASMKPDEQQYVINLLNLKENAMAMRSVLGAGQGSEDLRTAITKTIPNAMTPNSSYANAQLDTFLNTLGRLEKGIPQVNKPGSSAAPKATHRFNPTTGKIEVINGK